MLFIFVRISILKIWRFESAKLRAALAKTNTEQEPQNTARTTERQHIRHRVHESSVGCDRTAINLFGSHVDDSDLNGLSNGLAHTDVLFGLHRGVLESDRRRIDARIVQLPQRVK